MFPLTNRWAVLALLFFARASMAMQFQSVPPIVPFLLKELGINYAQAGLLIGLFMTAGIFLALPGGLLGQRLGGRALLLAGLAAMTAGAVLFGSATGFPPAFAGRLLGGIGVALLNVQTTKITAEWFGEKEISTAMGILLTAWPLGIALALSTLGFVAEAYSWRAAIHITAAFSGSALLLIGLLYRDRPAPAAQSAPAGHAPLWAISRRELGLVLTAGMAWLLPNAGFIIFLSFTPVLLAAGGMPFSQAVFTTGLVSWISLASVPLGGWLADRSGRVNLAVVVSFALCAGAVWSLPLGGSVLPAVATFGIALGGWPGAIMGLPAQALSPAGRGTGFGLFYTVYYVGMAILPPFAGWLHDATRGAAAPVLLAGGLLISPV
ncbi:MAG: MFS transporter, partial [bacterium]